MDATLPLHSPSLEHLPAEDRLLCEGIRLRTSVDHRPRPNLLEEVTERISPDQFLSAQQAPVLPPWGPRPNSIRGSLLWVLGAEKPRPTALKLPVGLRSSLLCYVNGPKARSPKDSGLRASLTQDPLETSY